MIITEGRRLAMHSYLAELPLPRGLSCCSRQRCHMELESNEGAIMMRGVPILSRLSTRDDKMRLIINPKLQEVFGSANQRHHVVLHAPGLPSRAGHQLHTESGPSGSSKTPSGFYHAPQYTQKGTPLRHQAWLYGERQSSLRSKSFRQREEVLVLARDTVRSMHPGMRTLRQKIKYA